jgi:hypothetical protein
MSEHENLPMTTNDDGFDETDNNVRIIQGDFIKCVDGAWSNRDGLPAPEEPLLVLSTLIVAQHWSNQKPIETLVKSKRKPLPNVDELNALIPRDVWEVGLDGEPKPPWQRQRVVYFLHEASAARFTYANGTVGANIAIEELCTRVTDMRFARGENVFPLVKLANKPMRTKYGKKLRPHFEIVGWRGMGSFSAPQLAGGDSDGGGMKLVEEPPLKKALDDEIPF